MVKYENQCCGCAVPAYPCLGKSCPRRHVKVYECDGCGEELDYGELFEFDDKQLCIECIKEELTVVE